MTPAATKTARLSKPSVAKTKSYGTSPLKRARRTSAEMERLLDSIKTILDGEEGQITIRHLYYRLVGEHVIDKTEQAYKGLCSHLSKWRRSSEIPWSAFTDSTRWHIQRDTFSGVKDALKNTVENYRRDLWATQDVYCEVWVEKDAVAGLVARTANSWGVPVFVARGFASLSSLYDAANTFRRAAESGKRVIIYHLGDYDPSGIAAGESMLKAFRDDFNVRLEFIRAAVTEQQIEQLKLPTRPTKKGDTRARNWRGTACVELDTMPPAEIREIVERCIIQHIDTYEWDALKRTEELERETLRKILRRAV